MKRLILLSAVVMMVTAHATAQFKQGDVELSFSGSLGSWNNSSSSSGYNYSESRNMAIISVVPGYYIVDGLSLEAELGLLAEEKAKPAQYLLGNVSYTYLIPESRVALFGRVGYGASNSVQIPVQLGIVSRVTNNFDVGVFNAGAGVKILVSQGAALRAEVSYKSHSWTTQYPGYFGGSSYKTEYTYSNTGLLLGFSILI
jgi:hypothetical protein